MIFVTGDIHGDISRFNDLKKSGIRKNDSLLVCGDFGFIWNGDKEEKKILKQIGKYKYDTLFVDGCNENFKLLQEYPIVTYRGGKARKISGNLYYAIRGEIYVIEGKNILTFGGGDNLDKDADFKDEKYSLPSNDDFDNAIKNLTRLRNNVDIIITHDAPAKIRNCFDMQKASSEYTELNYFFDKLMDTINFKMWYFGKYHINKLIPPRYTAVFTDCKKIDF